MYKHVGQRQVMRCPEVHPEVGPEVDPELVADCALCLMVCAVLSYNRRLVYDDHQTM